MDGEQLIKKAYESILAHDFEQAIDWFTQAIAVDPDNDTYYYKLSITCARSNKLGKALEYAEKACELNPTMEEYTFHLQNLQAKDLIEKADKFLHSNNLHYHLAVSLLKQAIILDPLSIEGYLLLGVAYAGLEEYNHAVQTIKEILILDPQHEIASKLLDDYKEKLKGYLQS